MIELIIIYYYCQMNNFFDLSTNILVFLYFVQLYRISNKLNIYYIILYIDIYYTCIYILYIYNLCMYIFVFKIDNMYICIYLYLYL
jgi:hypothetical protein